MFNFARRLTFMQMTRRIVLFIAAFLLAASVARGQDAAKGIVEAFRKGNSVELNALLDDKVSIVIDSKTAGSGKRAGEEALADFFRLHRVQGFELNHEGRRDESGFVVGTLRTAQGSYRVHCFLKKEKGNYFIHQIRINKNND